MKEFYFVHLNKYFVSPSDEHSFKKKSYRNWFEKVYKFHTNLLFGQFRRGGAKLVMCGKFFPRIKSVAPPLLNWPNKRLIDYTEFESDKYFQVKNKILSIWSNHINLEFFIELRVKTTPTFTMKNINMSHELFLPEKMKKSTFPQEFIFNLGRNDIFISWNQKKVQSKWHFRKRIHSTRCPKLVNLWMLV